MLNSKITNLEDLMYHIWDQWKGGEWYNDEYLYSGRQMEEIFIDEARKKFPGEPQAEIMAYAEQLHEAVDEQGEKWSSYN